MTPLREQTLEDMRIRNLSTETQTPYINRLARFARYCRQSPERVRPCGDPRLPAVFDP
jgi:hypothetical protein